MDDFLMEIYKRLLRKTFIIKLQSYMTSNEAQPVHNMADTFVYTFKYEAMKTSRDVSYLKIG